MHKEMDVESVIQDVKDVVDLVILNVMLVFKDTL
jgi:hypothetical protein